MPLQNTEADGGGAGPVVSAGSIRVGRDFVYQQGADGRSVAIISHELIWRKDELAAGSILDPKYRIAPFVGREAELKDLIGWCLDETQATKPLRLYVGPGGFGKTRFMLRACELLRDAHGWLAGFLDRQFDGWPEEAVKGLVESEVPKLVVLDYADTQVEAAAVLLQRLNARRGLVAPVRLVLLAREGPKETGDALAPRAEVPWIAELKRRSGAAQALVAGLRAIELAPLASDAALREASFAGAREAFARALNVPEQAGQAPPRPDLSADTFERVLFIHAAALASLEGRRIDDAAELLDYLVEREERSWTRGIKSFGLATVTADLVAQAAALITFSCGLEDRDTGYTLIRKLPIAQGQPATVLYRVIELLHQLYPGHIYLDAVRPDLIGEHLIERILSNGHLILEHTIEAPADAAMAFAVLQRIAKRKPTQGTNWLQGHGRNLEEYFKSLAKQNANNRAEKLALDLQPLIPHPTVRFRNLALIVSNNLPKYYDYSIVGLMKRVEFLNNLSVEQQENGNIRAALTNSHQAILIIKTIIIQENMIIKNIEHAAVWITLTNTLTTHSNNLLIANNNCGSLEAIDFSIDAIEIGCKLWDMHGIVDLNKFISSILILSVRYDEAQNRKLSFREAKRALKIFLKITCGNIEEEIFLYTRCLHNLSLRLFDAKRFKKACYYALLAVRYRRRLYKKNIDASEISLASSLSHLAKCQEVLDRFDRGLVYAQQSVNIRQQMAAINPIFRPDLEKSLKRFVSIKATILKKCVTY